MTFLASGAPIRRLDPRDSTACDGACRFIERLVAAALGVDPVAIRSRSRGRAAVARARQTAMYLAHVSLGLSLSQVGEHFSRDRTTVAHACARVEDSRDEPGRDWLLLALESAVEQWRSSSAGGGAAR